MAEQFLKDWVSTHPQLITVSLATVEVRKQCRKASQMVTRPFLPTSHLECPSDGNGVCTNPTTRYSGSQAKARLLFVANIVFCKHVLHGPSVNCIALA